MDTVLIFQKDQPLRVQNQLSSSMSILKSRDYHMIKTHFYDIIHSNHGVTLIWDRGTRILVKLNPKFKGINLLEMYCFIHSFCFLFTIFLVILLVIFLSYSAYRTSLFCSRYRLYFISLRPCEIS